MQIDVLQMVLLLKYIVSELIHRRSFFIIKNVLKIREKWSVSGHELIYGNIAGRIRCTVIRHLDLEKY